MAYRDDSSPDFWSKVQREELPHCGLCDPVTRQVELGDGRMARCPRCHPLQAALLPQAWRCPVCRALVYRDQRGLPCPAHRTIVGWHREYDAARSGAEPLVPDPAAGAGAHAARTALAARPRSEPPDRPPPAQPPPGGATPQDGTDPAPEPEPEPEPEEDAADDDFPF